MGGVWLVVGLVGGVMLVVSDEIVAVTRHSRLETSFILPSKRSDALHSRVPTEACTAHEASACRLCWG